MQVEELLEQSSRSYPDKIAVVSGGQQWTFGKLETAANRLANNLISRQIRSGDRVAIFLDNSVETVLSIFAVLKAGGVFVVLASSTKPARLVTILNDCDATALVTDEKGLALLEDCERHLPHLRVVYATGAAASLWAERPYECLSFDEALQGQDGVLRIRQARILYRPPAALIYTSGSTGESKGVVLTHLNITFATATIATYLENSSEDIILNVLSFSHSYGLTQLFTAFKVGATLILEDMFRKSQEILELIAARRVTGFAFTPTIAAALLEQNLGGHDLSALRYVTSASDVLPVATIRRFRAALPHVELFSMYGLTECIRVSFLPPDQVDIHPTSIGRGLPNQEIYIVDEQGNRLGPGLIGELVVQGPNVMQGYWRRPRETASVLRRGDSNQGVFYTGDLFRKDEEGFFHFVCRKDDVIRTCGEKVSPAEVESVLSSLKGIEEAVVVGVPDSILGQAVKTFVRLEAGATLSTREIIRHCSKHLEQFKVPTLVEFASSIPRTLGGKIERYKLAEGNSPET